MKLVIYTDGGARGNPGPAGIGVVIGDTYEHGEYIGETTNNVAEYKALVFAIKKAKSLYKDNLAVLDVEVRMDSELIVKQMKGEYKVKNEGLRPLFLEVQKLIPSFHHVSFHHIPREKNSRADALVNKALDAQI
ncbi:reverse transcriptase-like protein [Candidatus Parcubacteria bacterium]|jgi:ribonuclease HI|nr:MAG: reverse transcriptase-like protein [Candidatus Parcubacteria bacterium]